MYEDKKEKSLIEIVFDGVLDVAAKHLNKRLVDAIPDVLDWLINRGIEWYKESVVEYSDNKANKQLLAQNKSTDSLDKLTVAIEKCKSRDDNSAHNELIEVISFEISNNSLFWELLCLFTREVSCPYCNAIISENWYDYVLDESSCERNMGTETIYTISCDEYKCPKCAKLFKIEGFIETYPDGIYNNHELDTYDYYQ